MWKIGDLSFDGRVVLGPMSGFTSRSYREFMKPFGVAVSFSEMTSDMGIIHGQKRTAGYITFPESYATGVQLFGNDPDSIAKAARMALSINPNIDLFDINMGCPVTKIVDNHSGSALMRDPERCGDIVRAVKASVDVPVTAKIRLGWSAESMNFREVISVLEDAGVDAVTVHARTKTEGYSGYPHYDAVEGLQKEMSVPLIISGNIYQLDDAVNARDVTGAQAVMVARGGVGNPFLVTQIDRYFRTGERLQNPTISQQIEWCIQFIDMLIEEVGDDKAMRKLRCFAPKFIAGCHRCRIYRNDLATKVHSRESLISLLSEIGSKMGDERINSYALPSEDLEN